jgi:bifunctional UDP-N-acetylglucosamine pyrophosphorylase/glucosamine-1-phosphate N-acetyltransferase
MGAEESGKLLGALSISSIMTNNSLNVVVLAAGQGKRMHSDLPKVLHAIAGKPMLAHVLDTARVLGASRICVVVGHGGERVQQMLAATDVIWVRQERQLGTGHAVLQALPHLNDQSMTLVLYGDVPLTRSDTLVRLIESAHASGGLALVTAHLDRPQGYGRIVRANNATEGAIRRIVEEKDADDAEKAIGEINTGILAAPTGALRRWLPGLSNSNAQGEYYLTDIVALAVAEKLPVTAVHPTHNWETEGVNSKLQLAALERIQQRNTADRLLDAGVTLADPARIDVRGELVCGRDVFIDLGCIFEGQVNLGDAVRVGPYAMLRDVCVGAGSVVDAFCHLNGATIGADAVIGPFARLRPTTALADGVHIGNFVEVKNSTLGPAAKANHLSYVGDATVGNRVNVGAGTIVANYDGANKHRTVIEDDAQTGSNSVLVAPITVGTGATIAAGSTVTAFVPPGTLTIARARAVSLPGWKRPVKKAK